MRGKGWCVCLCEATSPLLTTYAVECSSPRIIDQPAVVFSNKESDSQQDRRWLTHPRGSAMDSHAVLNDMGYGCDRLPAIQWNLLNSSPRTTLPPNPSPGLGVQDKQHAYKHSDLGTFGSCLS